MNARTSILRAAELIEKNPHRFRFSAVGVPSIEERNPLSGTQGCALGWISAAAGATPDGLSFSRVSCRLLQVHDGDFYDRMDRLEGWFTTKGWRYDPLFCAKILRKYADKYHPAPKVARAPIILWAPVRVAAAILTAALPFMLR